MGKDRNSMLFWYPKIKDLKIPQPKTELYHFSEEEIEILKNNDFSPSVYEHIILLAKKIGFPLFMRTDQSSCKHGWKKTCYVPSFSMLKDHVFELLCSSAMQGMMSYRDNGIILREFLQLTTKFTAFYGEFPVNKERRYFIRNGELECHHPYWFPPAIRNPSIKNWRLVLDAMNYESDAEIKKLTKYAELVGTVLDGYWSVDFAMGKNSKWYLLDCALGKDSFHWLECEHCPKEQKELYGSNQLKPKEKTVSCILEELGDI